MIMQNNRGQGWENQEFKDIACMCIANLPSMLRYVQTDVQTPPHPAAYVLAGVPTSPHPAPPHLTLPCPTTPLFHPRCSIPHAGMAVGYNT